VLKGE
jgi:hypothetical protein